MSMNNGPKYDLTKQVYCTAIRILLFLESRVVRGGVRHYDVMRSEGDDALPAERVSGRHPSFRLVCLKIT